MNMLKPHRRNPSRRRAAPKKFEDEKFVSGRYDQYVRRFDGRFRREGRCHYYDKYSQYHSDFPESLLEFTSIWRDLNMVIPSALVEKIGNYLSFDKSSNQKGMLEADDEFIAADESEDEFEGKCQESDDESEFDSEAETEDEEEWDSEAESEDECDSDED